MCRSHSDLGTPSLADGLHPVSQPCAVVVPIWLESESVRGWSGEVEWSGRSFFVRQEQEIGEQERHSIIGRFRSKGDTIVRTVRRQN